MTSKPWDFADKDLVSPRGDIFPDRSVPVGIECPSDIASSMSAHAEYHPSKVYSNANLLDKDDLVSLISYHFGDQIQGKEIIILEKNAGLFKRGVDYLCQKMMGDNYPNLKLLEEPSKDASYLLGKQTPLYVFHGYESPGIIEIRARKKIDESISQKAFHLFANGLAQKSRTLIDEDGNLLMRDGYALTVVTNTAKKARRVWHQMIELPTQQRGRNRIKRAIDTSDYYERSDRDYSAYHVSLEMEVAGSRAIFEVHILDKKNDKKTKNLNSKASHRRLQKNKRDLIHSWGEMQLYIVEGGFGFNYNDSDDFQKGIIDQSNHLNRLLGSEKLVVYTLKPKRAEGNVWDVPITRVV
jgi:hypothetical protein